MLIAVLSDTHGRHPATERALGLIKARGVNTVLHCGDIEVAETYDLFRGLTAHFVFGNNDHDRVHLRQAAASAGVTVHEPYGVVEIDGKQIGFVHGDDRRLFRELEASQAFDYLFYGHSHHAEEHRTGPMRVINPGALHRADPKSFVLLDVAEDRLESLTIV